MGWGPLTHSPANICLQALIDAGLVLDPSAQGDWPGFVDAEPFSPDEAVTLYDQTGRAESRDGVTGAYARHFGVQVRVRSRRANIGAQKAHAIRFAMENVDPTQGVVLYGAAVTVAADSGAGVPAASYVLHAFTNIGDVLGIGQEPQTTRELHTLNAMAVIRQT